MVLEKLTLEFEDKAVAPAQGPPKAREALLDKLRQREAYRKAKSSV